MPWKHALRDGLLVAVTSALWWIEAGARGEASLGAHAVATLTGVMTALCGYLAHEWGHLLGARVARATVHLPARAASVFLFNFDSGRNGRGQFVAMSCGGFLASASVLALLIVLLPLDALAGRVALGLAGAGVVATAVLELPPFFRVLRGAPLPRGVAYR